MLLISTLFSSNNTLTSFPRASVILISKSRDRFCPPFSMRQIFDRCVPTISASCACDKPFSSLACVSFETISCRLRIMLLLFVITITFFYSMLSYMITVVKRILQFFDNPLFDETEQEIEYNERVSRS